MFISSFAPSSWLSSNLPSAFLSAPVPRCSSTPCQFADRSIHSLTTTAQDSSSSAPDESPLLSGTPCFTSNIISTPMPKRHREIYLNASAEALHAFLTNHLNHPAPQRLAQINLLVPQLNPELDVYDRRYLLQFLWKALTVSSSLNLRAKVLIQGRRKFGAIPLSISGLREMFDADLQLSRDAWPEDAVRSGELEIEDDVDDDDDIIFLLSPTNTVSIPVIEGVGKLVNRVGKRPVILLNPRLADVPSHGGVMQVTGRADRLTLLDSFEHIFFLKLLFKAGTNYPLRGILHYAYSDSWQVWRCEDTATYHLINSSEARPNPEEITRAFSRDRFQRRKKKQATSAFTWPWSSS